jgi:hypothetical protein
MRIPRPLVATSRAAGLLRAVLAVAVAGTTLVVFTPAASAALSTDAGCTANTLDANDDGYTGALDLGFTVDFFGTDYSSFYVNNNGNVTFDEGNSSYSGLDLATVGRPIVAPLFYDVDTRGGGSGLVTYGPTTVDGRDAYCVNWVGVGYFDHGVDRLNSGQLVLVDRSDIGPGDFDMVFNYGSTAYDDQGIVVGYSNGSDNTYTLEGSGTGTFRDGEANALVDRSVVIVVRNGEPVPLEEQTITFDTPTTSTYGEGDRILEATSSSGLVVTLEATGSCTLTGAVLDLGDPGTCTVTASQGGDVTTAPATNVVRVITINKVAQDLSVTPVTGASYGDLPVTIAASSSSGLDVTIAASGACALTDDQLSFVAAGTCTLDLTQAGDDLYEATSSTATFTVAKGSAALHVTDFAQDYTGAPRPVAVTTSPADLPGVAVTYDGSATAPSEAGTYAVAITFANDDWAADAIDGTLVIGAADQTITVTAPDDATYLDGPVTYTASASSGLDVSAVASGPCTLIGGSLSIDGAGTCTITADQVGDDNHDAAPTVVHVLTIARAAQTITVDGDTELTYNGSPGSVTTTSSADLDVFLSATGPCSVDGGVLTATGAGTCTVTATQAGSSDFEAADAVTLTVEIGPSGQTLSIDPLPTLAYGDTTTISWTSTSDLPVVLAASGPCSLSGALLTATGTGTCTVTASQAGDADHDAAADVATSTDIVLAGQSITVDLPKTISWSGPAKTVAAAATSGLDVTWSAAGACRVVDGALSVVDVGACTVTASQAGNENYEAATPVSTSLEVTPGQAIISFVELTQVEGEVTGARIVSDPTGVPASVTYSSNGSPLGSETVPAAPGRYSVVASVNDRHWDVDDVTATFEILAAETVPSSNAPLVKTGSSSAMLASIGMLLAAAGFVLVRTGRRAD